MTRSSEPHHTNLLVSIAGALEEGGRLSQDVVDFIETSLFPAAPAQLAAFLTGEESESERDSLLDLIFSPDLAAQIALEPLIEAACCSPEEEAALSGRLLARTIDAWIRMPDGSELVRIPVPDFIIHQYLARLKLSWQMDPRVAAAIDRGVSAAMALTVKVRLRNARISPTDMQQRALCRFFERMADDAPEYMACLDLSLSLLGHTAPDVDFYDRLVAHKRFLFRSLRQARRFETLLRRSNMETLMLQGVRAPHAPQSELIYHMRLIDLICADLYGKTEAIAPPMEDPLRVVTDLDHPAAAVRSLMDF